LHVFKAASGFAQEIDIEIAIRNTEVLALENNHVPVFSVLAPIPPPHLTGIRLHGVFQE
jgi:hypothetical protein